MARDVLEPVQTFAAEMEGVAAARIAPEIHSMFHDIGPLPRYKSMQIEALGAVGAMIEVVFNLPSHCES